MSCSSPENEIERSAALHSFGLMDAPRDVDFDDIARMASQVCGTPIGIVNLLDTSRQFFLGEVGIGFRESPLETSFCAHALLEAEMLVVRDAAEDTRFDGNPLVHENPGIRFYAGALLRTAEGLPIGTMCVLDTVPRTLDDQQIEMLRFLARQTMKQMELRRSLAHEAALAQEVRHSESRLRQIVDSSIDFAILTLDLGGRITSWNTGARNIFGLSEAEALSRSFDLIFTAEDRAANVPANEVAHALAEGRGIDERWHERKDGSRFWASGELMLLKDDAGRHVGYLKILRDRTHQREAELQREELMGELSHRMKNQLAMVQAIAAQTFRSAATLDEGRESFSQRVIALGRAQDILLRTSWDASDIGHLVEEALRPHRSGDGRILVEGPKLLLTADQGLGLSLAIHELATNAMKYGALSVPGGCVRIDWDAPTQGAFRFAWTESDGPRVAKPTRRGFGSRLIERIVAPYFDGSSELLFEPGGVRFELSGTLRPAGAPTAPS